MQFKYVVVDVLIIGTLLFFGWSYSVPLTDGLGKVVSMLTAAQIAMVVRQIELRRRIRKLETRLDSE